MKEKVQFLREIEQRAINKLESEFVMPVIGSSLEMDAERWESDLNEKLPELSEYSFMIMMPAAGE